MTSFNTTINKRQNTQKSLQQSGMILVLVLIFLLAITLLSVSSVTSSKLQLTLLNNQQTYLQAMTQLTNAQQLVFSLLADNVYSAQILNLSSILDSNNKLPDIIASSNYCDGQSTSHWLLLDLASTSDLSELTNVLINNNIKTYLSVISIEFIDNDSIDIGLLSKRLETLMIKQCFALGNSDLWLLQTSIITRRGIDRFSISSRYQNTDIKLVGN